MTDQQADLGGELAQDQADAYPERDGSADYAQRPAEVVVHGGLTLQPIGLQVG